MGTVKYSAEKAKKLKSRSDIERLKNMTEEEIEKAAKEDSDNPLLTEDELKQFRPTVHKGNGVYGHEKAKGVEQTTSKPPEK